MMVVGVPPLGQPEQGTRGGGLHLPLQPVEGGVALGEGHASWEMSTAVTWAAPAWAQLRAKAPVWVKQSSTFRPGARAAAARRLFTSGPGRSTVFWPWR